MDMNRAYDIAKTVLFVDAALFGLSTLSGAIFLDVAKRKKESDRILGWRVISFTLISFFCFFFALFTAFLSFANPGNYDALIISIGSTVAGCMTGSIHLAMAFADYLFSSK